MFEFIEALRHPDVAFFRYAFLLGALASISFGVMGTYVVARRISYLAGAIAHCVLGGIGAGLYLRHKVGISWFDPIYGAIIAALLAALVIGLVSIHARQREDTVIGALWATGMAVGLLFIAKTPGYVEPMSYLFGNILLISQTDLWLVIGLDLVVVGIVLLCYNQLLAVSFDQEFAWLRGLNTELYTLLLLLLTALTVVLLVRVVGIVMVIALLTLPAAVAGTFARTLRQMMLGATLCCLLFVTLGLALSFNYDLPSGPVIILVAAVSYLLALAGKKIAAY
ncbi:MAG TPA: metal ABC transporter permease [Desulfurivibrio alkaliphilus]|uniref:Metal ABC transporter permease n=1 Tax=Desulfurivibrio alkaliphilus TaxID=427923 RepID=A0A7C2XMR3_9BACT|nr:metal ABC transporter permease [Desulfurivibrio alkaliphilus]